MIRDLRGHVKVVFKVRIRENSYELDIVVRKCSRELKKITRDFLIGTDQY